MTTSSTDIKPELQSQIVRRGFRLIMRSIRADPINHALAFAGAIVYSLSLVGFTRALSWVTDSIVVPSLSGTPPNTRFIVGGVAMVMAVAFLRGIGAAIRRHFLAVAEYRTEQGWRHQLFDHYLEQPLTTLRRHPVGRLIAHLDSDVNTAGTVLKPLAFAAATVILGVVGMISLFEIHLWFGLLGAVLFPALAYINQRFSNVVEQPAADVQRAVGDVTSVAHESFDGAMMVKALGRQAHEVQRFESESEKLRHQRLVVGRINTMYQPLLRVLPNIGSLAMLMLGAVMIDEGSISLGDLIGAITLLSVLAVPLRVFAFFLQSMPPSVVALDRIDAFLAEDDRDSQQPSADRPNGDAILAFDHVDYSYVEVDPTTKDELRVAVLENVSFSIRPGEVVALVGATGSGKTTIAELTTGLTVPDGGTIRRQPDIDVALALQESFLFDASVSTNILLGANADSQALTAAAEVAQARQFISDLPDGYDTIVGERGVTLSGGQRQRLALARALLRQPELLILDDATSAIDPLLEADILDALRQQSLTMMVIANRLSTIRLADRVLFVNNHTIEASGTHDELMHVTEYRSLLTSEREPLRDVS